MLRLVVMEKISLWAAMKTRDSLKKVRLNKRNARTHICTPAANTKRFRAQVSGGAHHRLKFGWPCCVCNSFIEK